MEIELDWTVFGASFLSVFSSFDATFAWQNTSPQATTHNKNVITRKYHASRRDYNNTRYIYKKEKKIVWKENITSQKE